jgi:hypothetical protein
MVSKTFFVGGVSENLGTKGTWFCFSLKGYVTAVHDGTLIVTCIIFDRFFSEVAMIHCILHIAR